jgi:hypothetical protein
VGRGWSGGGLMVAQCWLSGGPKMIRRWKSRGGSLKCSGDGSVLV